MATPILATKLYVPALRSKTVPRPRLLERLNDGLSHKLILISAPAGSGKTTLVSEWAADCADSVAWLSLDDGDNDTIRFLRYLIVALQSISPVIGKGILGLLDSPQPPPVETLLSVLLNDIASQNKCAALVLDDYHLIDSQPVDEALAYFLEHLPPQMHVIMTTRADPKLPLSRLRARGQMIELRAEDLSFSLSEASEFLNRVMELNLSKEDISELESRTEGWIAGLQLAALSLRGQKDTAGFIRGFSGSHHYVLDYLIEEVIKQQPERVQTFLLCTSILDRMCGPLCDAVMEASASTGHEILLELEKANLFIIPLDNDRGWYRYHHLFADLLRQRLTQKPPLLAALPIEMTGSEIAAELNIRASQWYEESGLEVEAFLHAAAANDLDRAERLIDGKGMPLYLRGTTTPVLHWLETLPRAILDSRPSLWVTFGAATMISGHPSLVEPKLLAAEILLREYKEDDHIRDLIGQIAALRSLVAASKNDAETIIAQSNRALEYLHPDNQTIRTITTFSLGVAYELRNNRPAATDAYTSVFTLTQNSGNFMFMLAALSSLTGLQVAENKLQQAFETCQRSIQIVNDPDNWLLYDPYYRLAGIHYQWNDLAAAEEYARLCIHLAPQIECGTVVSAEVLLARINMVRGDFTDAADCLRKAAEYSGTRSLVDHTTEVAAAHIELLIHQGMLDQAAALAETHGMPLERARIFLASADARSALAILDPLRWKIMEMDQPDEQLKAMVLQSVAFYANGEKNKAVRILGDALVMARDGGFIRLFLDEGIYMEELLTETLGQGIQPDYADRLLAAFRTEKKAPGQNAGSPPVQPLIEPLTARELDVLRLIAAGLSNREICERLFLALSTVKGHSRVIFDKLQVQRRTEAVARARELGLL